MKAMPLQEQIMSDDQWVQDRWDDLVAQYADSFVAVLHHEVIASNRDRLALGRELKANGKLGEALIAFIERPRPRIERN